MTEQARLLVFEFFLAVGVAWFVYSYLYKRVRLDAFREELFTIRDELFDYMGQRGLPYDTRAYGLLRSSLNGMIRAADDGTFNFVTVSIYIRALKVSDVRAQAAKVAAIVAAIEDVEARKHFQEVFDRVGWIGLRHVWFEGPLSFVLTPALIVWLSTWDQRKQEVVEVGVELNRRENPPPAPQPA